MPANTPGRTPGKGRRERPYIHFNADPRALGTPMPTDVPVNDDGFEDPMAFMRSPTVSITNSVSRRTTLGAPSSVGTSRRVTKGRMSQLDGSDEDDMNIGPDANIMDDDDDTADTSFFRTSKPPNVPLPRRSELAPATPTTNIDDLPSPSVSLSMSVTKSTKRKSNLGASPNQSTRLNRSPLTSRTHDYDDDSMLLNDDDEDNVVLSPNSRRKSRRGTTATNKSGSSPRQSPGKRASIASRRSIAREQDTDQDEEDDAQDIEQSYAYDNGPMDDGGEGGEDDENMMVDEELAEEEIGLEEDDEPVQAEADADEDEDSGEETAVERPVSKAKKARAKAKATTTKSKPVRRARSRANSDASTSSASPIKRARVSGFPLVAEEERGEKYRGDFKCRRSGRSHIAPLEWWRGETVEYQPGEHLAEVRAVFRRAGENHISFAKKRTNRRAASKKSIEPSEVDDGTDYDKHTKTFGVVNDFTTNTEDDERRIAMPHRQLLPQEVSTGGFMYQKVFGEEAFAAAGVIRIPSGSKKPGKSSKDNAFFFFVHKGGLNVNVHRTSFNMGPGAMFMVPRGNKYSIENISSVEAELFFAQARKASPTEDDDRAIAQQLQDRSIVQTPATTKAKKTKTAVAEAGSTKKSKGKKK